MIIPTSYIMCDLYEFVVSFLVFLETAIGRIGRISQTEEPFGIKPPC